MNYLTKSILVWVAYLTFPLMSASVYPNAREIPEINPEWTKAFISQGSLQNETSDDFTSCISLHHWATYDDGPGLYITEVIDKLNKLGKKGTFFFVRSYILANRETLKYAYESAHQICSHTWSHRDLRRLTNDQIVAEIVWTSKLIHEIIGVVPACIRAPYGSLDGRVRGILHALGLDIISWNKDTLDYILTYSEESYYVGTGFKLSDTAEKVIPPLFETWIAELPMTGTISLQHDGCDLSAPGIVPSLDVLMKANHTMIKVSECINRPEYSNFIMDKISNVANKTNSEAIARDSKPGTSTTQPSSSPNATADDGAYKLSSTLSKSDSDEWAC